MTVKRGARTSDGRSTTRDRRMSGDASSKATNHHARRGRGSFLEEATPRGLPAAPGTNLDRSRPEASSSAARCSLFLCAITNHSFIKIIFFFSFFCEGYVEILFGDGRVIRKYMHAVMIGRSLLLFFPAGRRVFSKPFQKAIEFPNGLAIIIS